MVTEIYERIQEGLEEKQKEITEFMQTAPEPEKDLCLGHDEHCLENHLHVIESTLEKIEDGTLGVCVVCHGYVDSQLLEMDYTAAVCLDHYSEEERRRLESELELSQVVQRALLPQRVPDIRGVELAAFSRPSEIIGGDYFDFFQFRDGTHGLVIADVSGHGVAAGMLMSSLQTAIRTMAPDADAPTEILERINRFYIHNIHFTTFVTVFLARFDPVTLTLTYVNAGHNPPAVRRRERAEITWLKPTAPAIGIAEEFHPRMETIGFSEGDSLLLYTDGVTEVLNFSNEQFGQERLAQLVQQHADRTAPDLLQSIRQAVSAFGGDKPLADDMTMVALRIAG
ncbi:MAG TPA: PP2C family protein-serine/threonine phosphatase [Anaerolineales bacterium]|jgi:sigma-B regulation protein RsbU (phosphoserine phosphatase)|nr:PP2C family protein-serine/threonine phosphatase [Anaerolineales bacterium]